MLDFFNPERPALTPAEQEEETGLLRYIAQSMHLFGLCRYKRCFRDSACLHDPRECVARYAPLASDEARTFMRLMINTRTKDADIERFRNFHEEELDEFTYWRALVENVRAPGAVELTHLFEPEKARED